MVLLLRGDVLLHLFKIGLVHRKSGVASLPLEIGVLAPALLEPDVRDTFQFFYPLSLCDGAPKSRKKMNLIFGAGNKQRWAFESFRNAAQIRVQAIATGFIAQEWPALFCRKDQ